jgi:hypothetical protein
LKRENINTVPMYLQAHSVEFGLYIFERHNPLKSSNTSPNFLITLASLKSPVAGSPVRLNATAPTDVDLCSGPCFGFARILSIQVDRPFP